MRDDLLKRLEAAMPVDAVALSLHGAGVAESYPDIEGDLVIAVRRLVGPSVPIVGTFDLHGNISDECAATFDYMVPVWYYPHTDMYERGDEASSTASSAAQLAPASSLSLLRYPNAQHPIRPGDVAALSPCCLSVLHVGRPCAWCRSCWAVSRQRRTWSTCQRCCRSA